MRRKKAALIALGLLVAGALGLGAFSSLKERRERAERGRIYQAAFVSLAEDVKTGMSRQEVENILRQKAIRFSQRSGQSAYIMDDVVTLDRRKSPSFVCNYDDTIIRIIFERRPSSSDYDVERTDVVKAVVLESQPQQCL